MILINFTLIKFFLILLNIIIFNNIKIYNAILFFKYSDLRNNKINNLPEGLELSYSAM